MLGETAVAFWAEHDDAEYLARAMIGGAGGLTDDDDEESDDA